MSKNHKATQYPKLYFGQVLGQLVPSIKEAGVGLLWKTMVLCFILSVPIAVVEWGHSFDILNERSKSTAILDLSPIILFPWILISLLGTTNFWRAFRASLATDIISVVAALSAIALIVGPNYLYANDHLDYFFSAVLLTGIGLFVAGFLGYLVVRLIVFCIPIAVQEDISVIQACRKSWTVSRGQGIRLGLILAGVIFIALGVQMMVDMLAMQGIASISGLFLITEGNAYLILSTIVYALMTAVWIFLSAVITILIYRVFIDPQRSAEGLRQVRKIPLVLSLIISGLFVISIGMLIQEGFAGEGNLYFYSYFGFFASSVPLALYYMGQLSSAPWRIKLLLLPNIVIPLVYLGYILGFLIYDYRNLPPDCTFLSTKEHCLDSTLENQARYPNLVFGR